MKTTLDKLHQPINVRGFFVSLTTAGVDQLTSLKARFPQAEISVVQSTFEQSLDAARTFATSGRDPFTFIFIDHKGWTGFGLREITPLLRAGRTEVLINFMTGFISRFIDSQDGRYQSSFDELFGDPSCRDQWQGLAGLDREDQIVKTYCQRIARAGKYKHCVSNVILNPTKDRTHYHLVYGTCSDEGLVTFRGVERGALKFQQTERAAAQQRKRVEKTGQGELFGPALATNTYEDELRARYVKIANIRLDGLMQERGEITWDELTIAALQVPMISEADVKTWLKAARQRGALEVVGLDTNERVPKREHDHRVRRLSPR